MIAKMIAASTHSIITSQTRDRDAWRGEVDAHRSAREGRRTLICWWGSLGRATRAVDGPAGMYIACSCRRLGNSHKHAVAPLPSRMKWTSLLTTSLGPLYRIDGHRNRVSSPLWRIAARPRSNGARCSSRSLGEADQVSSSCLLPSSLVASLVASWWCQ